MFKGYYEVCINFRENSVYSKTERLSLRTYSRELLTGNRRESLLASGFVPKICTSFTPNLL
jgi:hypothetical protein